jgi:hypothetical protein
MDFVVQDVKKGIDRKSQSLHHHLFYHSLESEHDMNLELFTS